MENYIAIDNVCAWPNMQMLPGGEIAAVIFNQPCHLLWEGTIDCWISSDNGRSWEFRSNPVINDPETNRGNVAIGLNSDNEFIVLCGGWDQAQPCPGKYIQGNINDDRIKYRQKEKNLLHPTCSISKDNGKTWQVQDIVIKNSDLNQWVPYGDIITLADGSLACCMYGSSKSAHQGKDIDNKWGAYFMVSSDNGITWECKSRITEKGSETALIKLPNGKLLTASRSSQLDLYESTDEGSNWNHVRMITGMGQYPGLFTILDDGNLLLTYGIRNNGLYGVGGMLMDIEREHWYTPFVIKDFGNVWDGGYPASIQLENGEIVTAFYSGPAPHHNRYHMGVHIWNFEERKKLNNCPGK
ncbi:MAG: sialidase family protein [Planctomycetota bacterium]|jgi:hypothetical protein